MVKSISAGVEQSAEDLSLGTVGAGGGQVTASAATRGASTAIGKSIGGIVDALAERRRQKDLGGLKARIENKMRLMATQGKTPAEIKFWRQDALGKLGETVGLDIAEDMGKSVPEPGFKQELEGQEAVTRDEFGNILFSKQFELTDETSMMKASAEIEANNKEYADQLEGYLNMMPNAGGSKALIHEGIQALSSIPEQAYTVSANIHRLRSDGSVSQNVVNSAKLREHNKMLTTIFDSYTTLFNEAAYNAINSNKFAVNTEALTNMAVSTSNNITQTLEENGYFDQMGMDVAEFRKSMRGYVNDSVTLYSQEVKMRAETDAALKSIVVADGLNRLAAGAGGAGRIVDVTNKLALANATVQLNGAVGQLGSQATPATDYTRIALRSMEIGQSAAVGEQLLAVKNMGAAAASAADVISFFTRAGQLATTFDVTTEDLTGFMQENMSNWVDLIKTDSSIIGDVEDKEIAAKEYIGRLIAPYQGRLGRAPDPKSIKDNAKNIRTLDTFGAFAEGMGS